MVWEVAAVAVVLLGGAGAVVGPRVARRRAEAMLADGVAQLEARIVEHIGGVARVHVDGDPLRVLLALRDEVLPAGRIEVERCRLPNGLAVRRAELTTAGGEDQGHLVAHVSGRAISEQLGVPGLRVQTANGRLRLVAGVASVTVRVTVADGRVVLSIPVAPPPIGTVLSAGLTELVPRPPEAVELHDVRVVGDELEIRAVVDMRRFVAAAVEQAG